MGHTFANCYLPIANLWVNRNVWINRMKINMCVWLLYIHNIIIYVHVYIIHIHISGQAIILSMVDQAPKNNNPPQICSRVESSDLALLIRNLPNSTLLKPSNSLGAVGHFIKAMATLAVCDSFDEDPHRRRGAWASAGPGGAPAL